MTNVVYFPRYDYTINLSAGTYVFDWSGRRLRLPKDMKVLLLTIETEAGIQFSAEILSPFELFATGSTKSQALFNLTEKLYKELDIELPPT